MPRGDARPRLHGAIPRPADGRRLHHQIPARRRRLFVARGPGQQQGARGLHHLRAGNAADNQSERQ